MTAIHLANGGTADRRPARREALEALNDATGWVFATAREWCRRSRERNQLARLDDRLLADIGITRADQAFLVSKPFWRE